MGDHKTHDQVAIQDQNPQDIDTAKDNFHDPGVDPFGQEEEEEQQEGIEGQEEQETGLEKPQKYQEESRSKRGLGMTELDIAAMCNEGTPCPLPGYEFITITVTSKKDLKMMVAVGSPKDPTKKVNFNFPLNECRMGKILQQLPNIPLKIKMYSTTASKSKAAYISVFEVHNDGSYTLENLLDSGSLEDNDPLNNPQTPLKIEAGDADGLRTGGELDGICFYELNANRLEVDHHQKTFKFLSKNKEKWSTVYEAKSDTLELHNIKVSQNGEVSVILAKPDGQKLKQSFHLKDPFSINLIPFDASDIETDDKTNSVLEQIKSYGIIIHDNTNHISLNGAQEILNLIEKADNEIKEAIKINTIRIWITPAIIANGQTSTITEGKITPSLIWVHARFQDISNISGLTTTEKAIVHEIVHSIDLLLKGKMTADLTSTYNALSAIFIGVNAPHHKYPTPKCFRPEKDLVYASEFVTEKFLGLSGGHPTSTEEFIASFVASARLVPGRLLEVIAWAESNGVNVLTHYTDVWKYFYDKGIVSSPLQISSLVFPPKSL